MEFAAALLSRFSLIFDAGFGCAVRRGRRGCSGRVESCCGCVCGAGAPLAKCTGNGLYYHCISSSFFDIIFIVGQKGGGGFYVGFLKNGIFYLYTTLPLHYACQDSHIGPGLKLPLWQPAAARAASQK